MYSDMIIDSSKRLWIKQSSRRRSRWKLHSNNNDDVIKFSSDDFLLNRMGILVRVIDGVESIIELNFKIKRMIESPIKYQILVLTIVGNVIPVTVMFDNTVEVADLIAYNVKRIRSDSFITYSGNVTINSHNLSEVTNPLSIRGDLLVDNTYKLNEIIVGDEVTIRHIKTPYPVVDACRIDDKILLLTRSTEIDSNDIDVWIKNGKQLERLSLKYNCRRLIELVDANPIIEDINGNFYSIDVDHHQLIAMKIR